MKIKLANCRIVGEGIIEEKIINGGIGGSAPSVEFRYFELTPINNMLKYIDNNPDKFSTAGPPLEIHIMNPPIEGRIKKNSKEDISREVIESIISNVCGNEIIKRALLSSINDYLNRKKM